MQELDSFIHIMLLLVVLPTLVYFFYSIIAKYSVKSIYVKSILFLVVCILHMGFFVYLFKAEVNPFKFKIEKQTTIKAEDTKISKEKLTTLPKGQPSDEKNSSKSSIQPKEQTTSTPLDASQDYPWSKVIFSAILLMGILIYLIKQFFSVLADLNEIDGAIIDYRVGLLSVPVLVVGIITYAFLFSSEPNSNASTWFLVVLGFYFLLSHIIQIIKILKGTVSTNSRIRLLRIVFFYIGYTYVCLFGSALAYLLVLILVFFFLFLLFPNMRYRIIWW